MAHILVVDDDLDTVELSRELLESAGHQVRAAHTGIGGLASLRAAPLPDCLVLDVDMPSLDGPGMARQMILHDAGEEQIPILLVSGRSDLVAIAATVGTPYFLTKGRPGYARNLVEMIVRVLREKRIPTPA